MKKEGGAGGGSGYLRTCRAPAGNLNFEMTTFQPSFRSFRSICLFPTEFCSDLFRKEIFPSIPSNLHISDGIPYQKIPFRPRN